MAFLTWILAPVILLVLFHSTTNTQAKPLDGDDSENNQNPSELIQKISELGLDLSENEIKTLRSLERGLILESVIQPEDCLEPDRFKQFCNNETNCTMNVFKTMCPITCGECTTTSAPTTMPSTTAQPCEDEEKFTFLCEGEQENQCTSDFAKYMCRKTCNTCTITFPTPKPCVDIPRCNSLSPDEICKIPIFAVDCPILCKEERCKTTSTVTMSTSTTSSSWTSTPSTTQPSTTQPSTTQSSTRAPCKDHFEDCHTYGGKCSLSWVRKYCPETCGLCPTTTLPTTPIPCKEKYEKYCQKNRSNCKKYMYMLHFCPKTCGYC